jgi:LytS/YehU family sensor histidine kinase
LKSAAKQFGIWILIGSSIFFYSIWRKAIEKEQKLREENLKFRYQNLKNQINPHFLFNTLNTLSELVYIDAKKSDNFIQDLSSMYRYIMENDEVDLVTLDKELDFVKQYFNLQQARDGKKIKLDIEIPDTEKMKIVPVSLQILVENALKHNKKSEEKPVVISIRSDCEEIVVTNPIQKKSILEQTTKTGISNLKNRIKIITGKELVISEENNIFTVKLPTLRQ